MKMRIKNTHQTMASAILVAAVLTFPSASSTVHAALVGFQAEGGTLGAEFDPPQADVNALGGQFIETEISGGGGFPGSVDRVATYSVTFPETGTYDLYARLLIGPDGEGGNDDSLFYARDFGLADPTVDSDPIPWATVNGLPNAGIPTGQYVWVNLSEETGNFGETPSSLTVSGSLTKTYRIGAREDGLRIDAFAFGTSTETFTDAQLNALFQAPEPSMFVLAALGLVSLVACRRPRRR